MEALGLDMAVGPGASAQTSRCSSPLTPPPATPSASDTVERESSPTTHEEVSIPSFPMADTSCANEQPVPHTKGKAATPKLKRKEPPETYDAASLGPPRQSVRIRVKETTKDVRASPSTVLFSTTAENTKQKRQKANAASKVRKKNKKIKKHKKAEVPVPVADTEPKKQNKKDDPPRKKDQRKKPKLHHASNDVTNTRTEEQFSLEAMSAGLPFSTATPAHATVIISRKGKGKATDMFKNEETTDLPPETRRKGIRSSTFARVMRLVADLPLVAHEPPKLKRPKAKHRPPVWADSRQELCEALPYYRAFQSGLYSHQKIAFGYLLDGFPAPRDVCAHNARVIISHGGGQCIRPVDSDGKNLPPVLAGDQLMTDSRVAALVRAWERKTPLVLLAGSGYALLPFKLDCSYVILGWYWVSHVWTEAEPAAKGVSLPRGRDWYKRVKVRFDWVDSQGQPWWEKDAGASTAIVEPIVEFEPTQEAKRIALSGLMDGPSGGQLARPLQRPRLPRQDTVMSMYSTGSDIDTGSQASTPSGSRGSTPTVRPKPKSKRVVPKLPVDPKTGLLTPPITPPYDAHSRATAGGLELATDEPASVPRPPIPIVGESTYDGENLRRRLPGEYRLAAFGDVIQSDDSLEEAPFRARPCRYCKRASPTIYREGWTCLTTTCTAYWMLSTNIGLLPIPPGLNLTYDPEFLAHLATPLGTKIPYDIVPPPPKMGIPDEAGPADSAGSRSLWRGWVCENCGRANCRFRWEVWQCLSCKRLLAPIDPYSDVVPAQSLQAPRTAVLGNPIIGPDSGISVEMRRVDQPAATIMVYHLPHQIGTIYHFINDRNEFADGIFDRYQREAASTRVPLFQRRPLNAHQIKGQLLAQHFAVNSGASYKYNVDSLSLSFDESPSCVIQALDAITTRAEVTIGQKIEFNEILSVLYREGQKMSWHDDGEPGLGPVVAGLSLGSDAVISWRRKIAHSALNATFNTGLPDPRKEANHPIALSLTTSHGDIVMMQGRNMQKKYVHRVIPSGFRVAATAREIGK